MKNRSNIFGVTIFALLIVAPFSAGLLYALLYSFGLIGVLNHGFTLANWAKVLSTSEVWKSFAFSFYIAGVSLFVSVMLALLFTTQRKNINGSALYFIYLPLTLPAMVAAFFTFQFLSEAGFVSRVFNALHITKGIENFPGLVNDSLGIGIIVTHIMLALPFFIILFQNYYGSEKLETLKALSATLGASNSQFNRKILIPVLLKKATAPLALYFIFMLGSYEIPLLLGQQEPQMISVLINRKLNRFNLHDISQAYIVATVYTVIVSAMLLLIMRKKSSSYAATA